MELKVGTAILPFWAISILNLPEGQDSDLFQDDAFVTGAPRREQISNQSHGFIMVENLRYTLGPDILSEN